MCRKSSPDANAGKPDAHAGSTHGAPDALLAGVQTGSMRKVCENFREALENAANFAGSDARGIGGKIM